MPTVFRFWTASNVVILTGERAETLGALRDLVADCPNACLFYHTYQVLRDLHFVTGQYPNDFAQWVLTSARDDRLAERLAGIDIRQCPSMVELRKETVDVFDEHFALNPRAAGREGREPFHLARAQTVTMPTGHVAADPEAFVREIRRSSIRSIYYHFIESRLRFHLDTNDFSEHLRLWGFDDAARRVNELDIYSNTLYQLRDRIASLVESEARSRASAAARPEATRPADARPTEMERRP
jgi:hypothetical protein